MTGINGGLDTYAKGKTEMVLAVWQWGCAGTCKTSDKLEWPRKAKHGFDRCKVGLQWHFHASHIDDTLADASDTRIEKIPCQKHGRHSVKGDTVWSGRNSGTRRQRTFLDFFLVVFRFFSGF